MPFHRSRRFAAVTVGAAMTFAGGLIGVDIASSASAAPHVASAAASSPTTQGDREAAQSLFYDRLLPLVAVKDGWSGAVAGCRAGAPSGAALDASAGAVNLFRGMVGLAPITLDPELNAKAQAAALIMEAKQDLSHFPPSSWPCWTPEGAEGAGRSNLMLGGTGASAIWEYMTDGGDNNVEVGHRRWVMEPGTTRMGVGMTSSAHALWVISKKSPGAPRPEWIPWPVAGFSSTHLEPSGRWSLSSGVGGTDMAGAAVAVTGPGGPMRVTPHPVRDGYGPNTVVWEVAGLPSNDEATADMTYHVTVSGIRRDGRMLDPVSYDVTLVAPRPAPVPHPPGVTGAATPGRTLTVDTRGWPTSPRDIQWLRDGKPLRGETDTEYTVTEADLEHRLSVRAVATAGYHRDTAYTSAPVAVLRPLRKTTNPALGGRARVGDVLRATAGGWSPSPTRTTFQWYRGRAPITGAGRPTYRLAPADRGQRVRAVVTVERPGWARTTASTATVTVR